MEKIDIIYKNNKPYGIRNNAGFLLMFTSITKYDNQEERYRREVEEQFKLADFLKEQLEQRK